MRFVLLALLASACDVSGGTDGGPDAGTPSWPASAFEMGTSVQGGEYLPMPMEVTLIAGAQGGYHVEARYKIAGQRVDEVSFSLNARLTDGGLVSRGTRTYDVGADGGDPWISPFFPVFMCPTPVGVRVMDQVINFEITAQSAAGELLGRTNVTTQVRCEGSNYCEFVCNG